MTNQFKAIKESQSFVSLSWLRWHGERYLTLLRIESIITWFNLVSFSWACRFLLAPHGRGHRLCPLYNKFQTNFLIHTCIWSTPLALLTEFGEGQGCLCRSGLALSRNHNQFSLTPGDYGEREVKRKCLYSWWNILEYVHKWKSTFINEKLS